MGLTYQQSEGWMDGKAGRWLEEARRDGRADGSTVGNGR